MAALVMARARALPPPADEREAVAGVEVGGALKTIDQRIRHLQLRLAAIALEASR